MEEYLSYMKTLRIQMNDVEDQAAKFSVEEQMLITTIQNLEKDIDSAKFETKRVKEDTDEMAKAMGHICSQILEKQRKATSLESDSSTLSQTMELIEQERISLSAKLLEKMTYYTNVAEEINTKLLEQQDWINSRNLSSKGGQHGGGRNLTEGKAGVYSDAGHLNTDNLGDLEKNLMANLDAAKAKLEVVAQTKSELVSENKKVKESIELAKCRIDDYKPELKGMDQKALEEELQALSSDKAGESDYLKSLQQQIETLKGISHMFKCACGVEYKIEMDLSASTSHMAS